MSDPLADGRPEPPYPPSAQRKIQGGLFSFLTDRERLLQRFLLAEVLGPPKSRRQGR